jgi:transcriptional regulator with GAF, ATPase, and Fis domain
LCRSYIIDHIERPATTQTRLTAIAGPLAGGVFAIPPNAEFSIGRTEGNTVSVDDRAVSRRHCIIECIEGRFRLRDLGSHNLTYINNVPVNQHWLEDRDEIRVGRSIFLFRTTQDADTRQGRGEPPEQNDGATMVLHREDALYLDPNRAVEQIGRNTRATRDLQCLLEAADILCSERRLDKLANRILNLIARYVHAESAAVLLSNSADDPHVQFHLGRAQALPQGIIRRVMRDRVSVWTNDAQSGDTIDITDSVVGLNLNAVLAVPLVFRDRVLGVILAATHTSASHFEEADLQLLTGIAGLAAGSLDSALHLQTVETENEKLQACLNAETNLVGETAPIKAVSAFISKVAQSSSTVLITGESGTGKEVVARAIHRNSARSTGPYVAINCAALTESLLESELFGHEKGAFTGAISLKKGKLEEASGGTVFLDEVGELATPLQAKLLRVLQERELQRVGSTRTIKIDIRLIAATNRDLDAMTRSGTFRQDLFYRLNVVSIEMPPLRSRRPDIRLLALYFVRKHGGATGRRVTGISREALDCLARYEWPGNVRELENVIERAIVLGSTEEIMVDDLPESVLETGAPAGEAEGGFHELVNEAKRRIVLAALDKAGGSYADAARQLGIHPNNLHRVIRNLNIKDAAKR